LGRYGSNGKYCSWLLYWQLISVILIATPFNAAFYINFPKANALSCTVLKP
jgi:hypothetical protein